MLNDALVNKQKENYLIKTKAKNLAELLVIIAKTLIIFKIRNIIYHDISKILNIKLYRAVRKLIKLK